jgi:mRNA interferase RelE/StbE
VDAQAFNLVLVRSAAKDLQKLPEPSKTRVIRALQFLTTHPYEGKALKGELAGSYSLRVWPYRIIYSIEKEKLLVSVVAIGHRQGIYKQ